MQMNGENLNYVLGMIDSVLFLWALFQLIRFRVYSMAGVKNLKPKRFFHFIIAVAMFGSCCVLLAAIIVWISVMIFWVRTPSQQVITEQVSEGVVCALFLASGVGFFVFGILLYLSFRKFGHLESTSLVPSENSTRSPPEAIRAAVVGAITTVCFCIRASVMLYSLATLSDDPAAASSTTFNFTWGEELAFFFVTEILPTVMMLFRLRKMKKPSPSSRKQTSFGGNDHKYHDNQYNNNNDSSYDSQSYNQDSFPNYQSSSINAPYHQTFVQHNHQLNNSISSYSSSP
eukprot:gene16110-19168_t